MVGDWCLKTQSVVDSIMSTIECWESKKSIECIKLTRWFVHIASVDWWVAGRNCLARVKVTNCCWLAVNIYLLIVSRQTCCQYFTYLLHQVTNQQDRSCHVALYHVDCWCVWLIIVQTDIMLSIIIIIIVIVVVVIVGVVFVVVCIISRVHYVAKFWFIASKYCRNHNAMSCYAIRCELYMIIDKTSVLKFVCGKLLSL